MKKILFNPVFLLTILLFSGCEPKKSEETPTNPLEKLIATHIGTCIKNHRDLTVSPSKVKIDTTLNSSLTISHATDDNVKVVLEGCSALTGGYTLTNNAQATSTDTMVFDYASKGATWTAEGKLLFVKSKKQILTSSRQLVSGDNETQYSAVYQLK
jgi:hypothetical protein